jgi:nitroimidazol reductase NimA-like FMN-containing flavoprotein (pyridoxamine 5'-phosphate oxidase superfamily)
VADFAKTERTRMRRKAKRATYDRETIYAILDEALIASVAVSIKGQPNVQPMIHRRLGDRLILHGLATNRLLNAIAEGAEACINVFHLDALAIARKIEDHSMLYRSATIYGRGELVGDEAEKLSIMGQVFASLVGSGRLATLPPLQPGYLGGTMVVAVPIDEAVGKVNDQVDTDDGPDGIWSGLVPVRMEFEKPIPDKRTAVEQLTSSPELANYSRRS